MDAPNPVILRLIRYFFKTGGGFFKEDTRLRGYDGVCFNRADRLKN